MDNQKNKSVNEILIKRKKQHVGTRIFIDGTEIKAIRKYTYTESIGSLGLTKSLIIEIGDCDIKLIESDEEEKNKAKQEFNSDIEAIKEYKKRFKKIEKLEE